MASKDSLSYLISAVAGAALLGAGFFGAMALANHQDDGTAPPQQASVQRVDEDNDRDTSNNSLTTDNSSPADANTTTSDGSSASTADGAPQQPSPSQGTPADLPAGTGSSDASDGTPPTATPTPDEPADEPADEPGGDPADEPGGDPADEPGGGWVIDPDILCAIIGCDDGDSFFIDPDVLCILVDCEDDGGGVVFDPGLIDPGIFCAIVDCEDDASGADDADGPVVDLPSLNPGLNLNPGLLCAVLGTCAAEDDDSDDDPDFKLPDSILDALGGLGGS